MSVTDPVSGRVVILDDGDDDNGVGGGGGVCVYSTTYNHNFCNDVMHIYYT